MVYAFFDFDGTLTEKDTLKGFARFYWGKAFKWKLLQFLPFLVAFRLKFINHNQAKAWFVRFFYAQQSVQRMNYIGEQYVHWVLPNILQLSMVERLKWHLNQGHEVCIVTASLPYWIEPWCRRHGITLLATKAQEVNGHLTGKLDGLNCYGDEKVERILQAFSIKPTDEIFAYGDTESDYPMMDMANTAFDCSQNINSSYTLARKEPWYA